MKSFWEEMNVACKELGIEMKLLVKSSVIKLTKNNQIRFVYGDRFDVNPHALGSIMDDKYATYEVLKELKAPVVETSLVLQPRETDTFSSVKTISLIEKYFEQYHNNIVIKSLIGSSGKTVFHIKIKEEIKPTVEKLLTHGFLFAVSPFYQIKKEYRLIYLDGKCYAMYAKTLPKVVGDGKRSIRELLMEKNAKFFFTRLNASKYSTVLKKGVPYQYDWKFNYSCGGGIEAIKEKSVKEKLLKIADPVISTLGISFCSIDIIETKEGKFLILELNSGIGQLTETLSSLGEPKKKIDEFYKRIISSLFEK